MPINEEDVISMRTSMANDNTQTQNLNDSMLNINTPAVYSRNEEIFHGSIHLGNESSHAINDNSNNPLTSEYEPAFE